MVFGVKSVARYMKVTFVVVWIGMAIWLVLMLFGSHHTFISNWNHSSGTTYSAVLAKAGSLGFNASGGIKLGATLAAMVYCFQVYTGFQWTGYFAGEIKNARRTARTSIVGGLGAAALIYVIASLLIYKYYGYKFFGSLVYLGLGGGSSHSTLAFSPYLPTMVKFLPGGQVLTTLIVCCFLLAIFWWTPTGFMLGTRNLFAWSFDRLAPAKVTDVSDRFHTPVVATVIVALFVELLNYLNIYQGLGAFLLNVLVAMGLAFIVVSIAAGAVPYRRKAMHAEAPGWARAKLAGRPSDHAGRAGLSAVLGVRDLRGSAHWVRRQARLVADDQGVRRPGGRDGLVPGRLLVPAQPGDLAGQHVQGDPTGMSARPRTNERLVEEGRRLIAAADGASLPLRLFGGVAIWLRSSERVRSLLRRDFADLDFVAHRSSSRALRELLEQEGYLPPPPGAHLQCRSRRQSAALSRARPRVPHRHLPGSLRDVAQAGLRVAAGARAVDVDRCRPAAREAPGRGDQPQGPDRCRDAATRPRARRA